MRKVAKKKRAAPKKGRKTKKTARTSSKRSRLKKAARASFHFGGED